MKKLIFIMLLAMLPVAAMSAPAGKDDSSKTVVFTVSPKMHCNNCENKIKNNIRYEKGVSRIATDLKKQTVTVTYDSEKTNTDNLSKAFKKIGYTAKECKADVPAEKNKTAK
ncbi:MAG: heavy-metal-associated domain-containing protein [Muribaculaceae bacterium]|nr:heavy-metal-associated domain-containing protein [Muribaculaceae bacterium]